MHVQLKPTFIQFDRTVFDVREVIFYCIVPLSNQIIALCLLGDQLQDALFPLCSVPIRRRVSSALCHHKVPLQEISKDNLRSRLKFSAKIALMHVREGISASNTLVLLLDTRNRLPK